MLPLMRMLAIASFPAGLVAIPLVGTSQAGGTEKIAGTFTMAYVAQEKLAIPDAAGQEVLLLTEARGAYQNTGASDFMSGSQVAIRESRGLVQGNGTSRGYVVLWRGADTLFVAISGKVTTTLSPEGSPRTNFAGTWAYTKGDQPAYGHERHRNLSRPVHITGRVHRGIGRGSTPSRRSGPTRRGTCPRSPRPSSG